MEGGRETADFAALFHAWKGETIDSEEGEDVLDILKELNRTYTYKELVNNPPKGLEKTRLESYLSDGLLEGVEGEGEGEGKGEGMGWVFFIFVVVVYLSFLTEEFEKIFERTKEEFYALPGLYFVLFCFVLFCCIFCCILFCCILSFLSIFFFSFFFKNRMDSNKEKTRCWSLLNKIEKRKRKRKRKRVVVSLFFVFSFFC